MKILQLTKHYPPDFGGVESVTFDLTEGLNATGIQCDVLCANKSRKNVVDLTGKGYKVFRVARLFKMASTSIAPGLITKLKKVASQYDIIHVHCPDPMAMLALRFIQPTCPVVVHWHSDIVKQKILYKFIRPLETWLLKRAASVIVTSGAYVEASESLRAYRDKVSIVPIGIPDRSAWVNKRISTDLINKYAGRKIVFALGRHVYYKGFENLIAAASLLEDDFVVLIGGTGPLTGVYEKQIADLKLEKKVILTGSIAINELSGFYDAASIFCLPSNYRSEAFGVVLIEAMQYSLPVVATRIAGSGVSWVNEEGGSGYNVAVNDPKAIADCINSLGKNEALLLKMADQARRRYLSEFTADKMISSCIVIYKKILASE